MTETGQTAHLSHYPGPRALAGEEEIYAGAEFPEARRPFARPYVLLNMISSLDGRSSLLGKASFLGGPADRRAMRSLRSLVDAVMVGAGTLRAERLNLGLDERDARQPLAIVVAGSGVAPLGNLIRSGEQKLVVAIPDDSDPAEWRSSGRSGGRHAELLRIGGAEPGSVDVAGLLGALKARHGVDLLLVEGGPALNRSLMEADLVDEVFLTIAPKILGGPETAIVASGDTANPRDATLVSAHTSQGELFLRYRLDRSQ